MGRKPRRDIPIKKSIEWGFRVKRYLDELVDGIEWTAKKILEVKDESQEVDQRLVD